MKQAKEFQIIFISIGLLFSYIGKAETLSAQDRSEFLIDSLHAALDTMPRNEEFFKTLSSIEMMLMKSPRFLHYAEMKEQEGKKQNRMNYVCESYSDRAIYYHNARNIDSFYYFKNLMDPLALELKEYNYYFFLGNTEVTVLVRNGKVESAIQTAKKLYEEAKKYNDDDGLIASNMSIGLAMNGAKRYEEAYSSYETALALMKEKGKKKPSWLLNIYSYLIVLSDDMKKYAQGLEYVYQKEKVIEEMRGNLIGNQNEKDYMLDEWCDILLKKVYFNIKLNNTEKAWKQLQKIKEYYPSLGIGIQNQFHHASAEYYEAIGDYPKALSELDSAYSYYKDTNIENKIQLMGERAELLAKNKAYKESTELYQEYITLKDSLNNKWMEAQVGELRAIYDTDHLKLVNSQLELQNKHSQMQTIIISLVISILALFGIMLLYIRIYRIKKKLEYSEEELRKEKEQLKIAKEKAEEARDLAQKAERKESFFANMSHEIRTPLNAIVGFSNLLVSDEELTGDERTLFTKMINQNCEQLLKLVNDVLDLSRMESGKMSFSFENYNLSELMDEVYNTNQMLVPKQLNFLKSVPKQPLFAHIDKMRLRQVLFNFINNATKFTVEGHIRIGYELDQENKEIKLFVEDTGRGIPEEHQKKIFERFYKQVDTDQGTGLGLSICTVIAEKQGGRLMLTSEEGKGSCFSIILPYDESLNN